MLVLIWTASLVLSAISLLVMGFLIVKRVTTTRVEIRNLAARQKIMKAMIRVTHDNDTDGFLAIAANTPRQVTANVSAEFLGLVRGKERQTLVDVLRSAGQLSFLENELQRGNEAQRLYATELIAASAPLMAVGPLLGRLRKDRSREVRIAAAIELAKIGTVPPLGELLKKLGAEAQQSGRLAELFQLLPDDSQDDLRDLARDQSAAAPLRASALQALWVRDQQVEPSIFSELAEDDTPIIAAACMRALGRVGNRAQLPLILSKLHDPAWEVRLEAAEAVGRLGGAAEAQDLTALLDDDEWAVRLKAAQALMRMGPAGQNLLLAIAGDSGGRKQRIASLVLLEDSSA